VGCGYLFTGCTEGKGRLCRDLDFLFYTRAHGGDAGVCVRIRVRVCMCAYAYTLRVHVRMHASMRTRLNSVAMPLVPSPLYRHFFAINGQRKGPLCASNRHCYALLLRTIAVESNGPAILHRISRILISVSA